MSYRVIDGVPVFGEPIENAVKQAVNCRRGAAHVALMADHHLGYAVPIGGVVAYEGQVSPSGVGYDIGCGNKAVRLDIPAPLLRANIRAAMDDIWRGISFGVGRRNAEAPDDPLFRDDPAWSLPAAAPLRDMAMEQLGTVGSGNHYVDLFVDERDRAWCGVHFGSRGLGHRLATHYLKLAGGRDALDADPVVLDVDSTLGREYLAAMRLAGRYAEAGRNWVCARVAGILGATIVEEVHNHHNYAWPETHGGRDFWVVRKGATPAFPGQKGFIGGSMGDVSVIVEGVDSPDCAAALHSTVHGAGRVLSRTQAAGSRWKRGGDRGGQVSRAMMLDWIGPMGVELRGAGTDESPHCYKRLPAVLAAQGGTIRVLHTLAPIGVAMAGADEHDPYRD